MSLFSEGAIWIADLISSEIVNSQPSHNQMVEVNYVADKSSYSKLIYRETEDKLWTQKIQEIRDFQCENTTEKLTENQINLLIGIYEKYRAVFSDKPGKVKNYQCKIRFREPVELSLIHI